jgi:hypothetical protein
VLENLERLEFLMRTYKVKKGVRLATGCLAKPLQYLLSIELLLFLRNVVIIRLFLIINRLRIGFGSIETGPVHVGGIGLEQAFFIVGVFENVACGFAIASCVKGVHYSRKLFKNLIYQKLY